MRRWSAAAVLVALLLVVRAAPVGAQAPPSTARGCQVVAGVEVGCDDPRRSSDSDDEALPWLLFGLVLLPVAFLAIAAVLIVPLLSGAGRLRRRWVRRSRRP